MVGTYPPAAQGRPPQGYSQQTVVEKKGPGYGGMALAGVGGLAAGALLMHEGEKVRKLLTC